MTIPNISNQLKKNRSQYIDSFMMQFLYSKYVFSLPTIEVQPPWNQQPFQHLKMDAWHETPLAEVKMWQPNLEQLHKLVPLQMLWHDYCRETKPDNNSGNSAIHIIVRRS